MKEIWKDIKDFEGIYQVSNLGRIKSLKCNREKILKLHYNKGYCKINLTGKSSLFVHRLVAQAFINNPENKPQINHIDKIRSNNCIDNLEWVTSKENLEHRDSVNPQYNNFKNYLLNLITF